MYWSPADSFYYFFPMQMKRSRRIVRNKSCKNGERCCTYAESSVNSRGKGGQISFWLVDVVIFHMYDNTTYYFYIIELNHLLYVDYNNTPYVNTGYSK